MHFKQQLYMENHVEGGSIKLVTWQVFIGGHKPLHMDIIQSQKVLIRDKMGST